jgi:hypothetical protein
MVARFEFDGDEEDPFRPLLSGLDERFQMLVIAVLVNIGTV